MGKFIRNDNYKKRRHSGKTVVREIAAVSRGVHFTNHAELNN